MPATAREPSGTLVEVLCGQPLQNQGARSGPAPARGDRGDDEALLLGLDQRDTQRHSRRDVGIDAEPGQALGDRLGDDRRRQVGLGAQQPVLRRIGLAPFAAGLVALRFVELAEHVRPHVGPPAVELLLDLVLDDLALLLDHQDLFEAEREVAGDRRFQRPDDVDLVQAQADAAAGLVVEAEVGERLARVVVGLARGDDAEAVVRALDDVVVEAVGAHVGERRVPLVVHQPRFLLERRVGPADVQAAGRHLEVLGQDDVDPVRIDRDARRRLDDLLDRLHRPTRRRRSGSSRTRAGPCRGCPARSTGRTPAGRRP